MCLIETTRVCLRRFETEDLDAYHKAIFADPDVMKYLPGGVPRPRERTALVVDHFLNSYARVGFGGWAMIERASGQLIGHCGLQYIPESEDIELFYAIASRWWGQGLTTEAAQAVLAHGFGALGLTEICAVAVPENTASRRVMEKIGMRYIGVTDRYYAARLAHYVITAREFVGK